MAKISDKKRDAYLRRTYGITARQYACLLKMQYGRCAVCHTKPKTRRLHVDHDHKTGRVRGLLCFRCNKLYIGQHTLQTAKALVEYLEAEGFDGRKIEETASPKIRRKRITLPPMREVVLPAPVA